MKTEVAFCLGVKKKKNVKIIQLEMGPIQAFVPWPVVQPFSAERLC